MSNSSIRTTVTTAVIEQIGRVPAGYERVVDAVVEAVEGLVESAADSLRESGSALGASEEEVESALVSAGLIEPTPVEDETVPTPEDPARDERLSKIEAAVERLTALAERHLGTRF